MNALAQWWHQGGPVLAPIVALALVLYTRCFTLAFQLFRQARPASLSIEAVYSVEEMFLRERVVLAALIGAAPLLGLLGTVSGMIRIFSGLGEAGGSSMETLAKGVSEVLVATESGLAVAIPGMIFVAVLHAWVRRRSRADTQRHFTEVTP